MSTFNVTLDTHKYISSSLENKCVFIYCFRGIQIEYQLGVALAVSILMYL